MNYQCPICKEGTIDIQTERTGEPGFRTTDYTIVSKTCDCITYECEAVAIAIENYKEGNVNEGVVCEECHQEKAVLQYPTKAWNGEYKEICAGCFQKEMEDLQAKYSANNR